MVESKNKIITIESLSALHEYNKDTYETRANVETLLNTKFDKPENNIVPIINGGTGAESISDARVNLEAQKQHVAISITLSINGWHEKTQVVNIDGVTNGNTIIVTPAPESRAAYNESDVHCSAQANKMLTFKCDEVPKAELVVNVLILD